ncbi:MAG: hypothetical protein ACK4TA_07235, partial [Saprospiraceae bacterium]
SNFIPVDKKITASAKDEQLYVALDRMFLSMGVVYKEIGSQVVLKMGNNFKPEGLSQINTLPKKIKQTSPIYPLTPQEQYIADLMKKEKGQSVLTIEKTKIEKVSGGDSVFEANIQEYKLTPVVVTEEEEEDFLRLAQVSILPFVGTNALRSNEMINNVSFNLFWGTNGGVDGMEVGGFVNTIKYDVNGLQVAGLGNTVGGNVVGTQAAGLFNATNGSVQGVQTAGLFNLSGEAKAVQAAGLFNVSDGDFVGVQAAGLFNVSDGKADGVQASGLFNIAGGKTKAQFSSLFNIAKDVEVGQVSSILNVGKKVNGFQIALINVADSTSGVPIGLLNIIKKGYNRVEFSASEALLANFALKLGARSFYNIFHFGARWDDVTTTPPNPGNDPNAATSETRVTWALGYGIGTTIGFGKRTLLNLEAVSMHVNEQENWTEELNMLNQLRLLFDVRTGRHTSLFAGPVGNIMVSKLNREGVIGSTIMPYTQFEETTADTNVKMWVGFNAGIRF